MVNSFSFSRYVRRKSRIIATFQRKKLIVRPKISETKVFSSFKFYARTRLKIYLEFDMIYEQKWKSRGDFSKKKNSKIF